MDVDKYITISSGYASNIYGVWHLPMPNTTELVPFLNYYKDYSDTVASAFELDGATALPPFPTSSDDVKNTLQRYWSAKENAAANVVTYRTYYSSGNAVGGPNNIAKTEEHWARGFILVECD